MNLDVPVRPRSLRRRPPRHRAQAALNRSDDDEIEQGTLTGLFLRLVQKKIEEPGLAGNQQITSLMTPEVINEVIDGIFEILKPALRRGFPTLIRGLHRDEADLARFLERVWGAPDALTWRWYRRRPSYLA